MSDEFDLSRMREILEKETYPSRYVQKVVGNNNDIFRGDLATLEAKLTRVVRTGDRLGGSGKYLSVTYELMADTPEEILELIREVRALREVLFML